jgi:virginiamycin B lyase
MREAKRRRLGVELLESRRLLTATTLNDSLALPAPSPISNPTATPLGITAGPDGQVWFTESGSNQVDSITPGGGEGTLGTPINVGSDPWGIVYVPGGDIWFAEHGANAIGRIDPTTRQYLGDFATPTSSSQPVGLTYDPANGMIYFTEPGTSKIGFFNPATITSSADISEVTLPNASAAPQPYGITYDPGDGNIWFTERAANQIGMFDPSTQTFNSTPYSVPDASSDPGPFYITAEPDGDVWFSEVGNGTGTGLVDMFSPTSGTFAANGPYSFGASAGHPTGYVDGITTGPDGDIYFTASTSQIGYVGWFNPTTLTAAGSNYGQDLSVLQTPNSQSAPYAIAAGSDGNVWFTELDGNKGDGAIGVADLGLQVAVATQPPSSVVAGSPFGLTVDVTYTSTGAVDKAYNGPVSVGLGNSTLATATAAGGVASFSGLTLNNAGNSDSLTVSIPTTPPTTSSTTAVYVTSTQTGGEGGDQTGSATAPTIIVEQLTAFYARHNKKGKAIGKPDAEVLLTFSIPMSTGTIDNAGNYQVAWESTRKIHKKVQVVYHPVPIQFEAAGSSDTVVALATSVLMKKFAKGWQVVIVSPGSIQSAAGVALGGSTTFSF